MKCRETAGILFPRPCENTSSTICRRCQRPICDEHRRNDATGDVCVTCLKEETRTSGRGSPAWMRDDPYFYWYSTSHPHHHDFTAADRALFDRRGALGDDEPAHTWTGS